MTFLPYFLSCLPKMVRFSTTTIITSKRRHRKTSRANLNLDLIWKPRNFGLELRRNSLYKNPDYGIVGRRFSKGIQKVWTTTLRQEAGLLTTGVCIARCGSPKPFSATVSILSNKKGKALDLIKNYFDNHYLYLIISQVGL